MPLYGCIPDKRGLSNPVVLTGDVVNMILEQISDGRMPFPSPTSSDVAFMPSSIHLSTTVINVLTPALPNVSRQKKPQNIVDKLLFVKLLHCY